MTFCHKNLKLIPSRRKLVPWKLNNAEIQDECQVHSIEWMKTL